MAAVTKGLENLQQAIDACEQMNANLADATDVPVIGIGGIDGGNVESVMRSGASGAAVIRAISESDNTEGAARELKRRMVRAWERLVSGPEAMA